MWSADNECLCRLLVHKVVTMNNVTMNRNMKAAVHKGWYNGVALSEPVNVRCVRDALVFKAIIEQQPTLAAYKKVSSMIWSLNGCLVVIQLWNRSQVC